VAEYVGKSPDDSELAKLNRRLDHVLTAALVYLFVASIVVRFLIVDGSITWPLVVVCALVPLIPLVWAATALAARVEGTSRREVFLRGFRPRRNGRP
jgi:hypothetical protein